jgi:hypothetical protein
MARSCVVERVDIASGGGRPNWKNATIGTVAREQLCDLYIVSIANS